ncbi:hypothetical protein A9D14_12315 [Croceicoccus marinus]|jgi:hypothetical protein|uniref:Uncharacterized protein n=1 Tax=Croceicoccus marinus TaxID=450378 RepID=A0A1Z1FDN1_9SPHN|nr:hypothetical protein A9D14_12315 [Croceicoccus marinus]
MGRTLLNTTLVVVGVIILLWVALAYDNTALLWAALTIALAYVAALRVITGDQWGLVVVQAILGLVAMSGIAWFAGMLLARSL